MPENRKKFSYVFKDWENGLNAAREIMQGEFGFPSVFRLSDPEETSIAFRLYGVADTVIDKMLAAKGYKDGKRVLMLDMDIGLRSLDLIFGTQKDVLFDWGQCYRRRMRAESGGTRRGRSDADDCADAHVRLVHQREHERACRQARQRLRLYIF